MENRSVFTIYQSIPNFKPCANRRGRLFALSGMSSFKTTLIVHRLIRFFISSFLAWFICDVEERGSFMGITSVMNTSSVMEEIKNGDKES